MWWHPTELNDPSCSLLSLVMQSHIHTIGRGVLNLFTSTVAVFKSTSILAVNMFILFSPLLAQIITILLGFILAFCRVPEFEYSKSDCWAIRTSDAWRNIREDQSDIQTTETGSKVVIKQQYEGCYRSSSFESCIWRWSYPSQAKEVNICSQFLLFWFQNNLNCIMLFVDEVSRINIYWAYAIMALTVQDGNWEKNFKIKMNKHFLY